MEKTDTKRILFVSEASFFTTGFARYGREVMTRLHADPRFEIAELASGGKPDDSGKVPWKFFPNELDADNPLYGTHDSHRYGSWQFDNVVESWEPDIVFCYRDPWMDYWIPESPNRSKFRLVMIPTVDSSPQDPRAISYLRRADAVLTNTQWAFGALSVQAPDINLVGVAGSGVDFDTYQPARKSSWRSKALGDSFVVGSVMQNTSRKRPFEMLNAFRSLKQSGRDCVLIWHMATSPNGYCIEEYLKASDLHDDVLFSYVNGGGDWVQWGYEGEAFGDYTLPNHERGLSDKQMVELYGMMDIYVQSSSAEGFGIPVIEASACGVPAISVGHGAMGEVVRNCSGIETEPAELYLCDNTHGVRVKPDPIAMRDAMIHAHDLGNCEMEKWRKLVRYSAMETYSWDQTCCTLADCFNSLVGNLP